MKEIKLDEKKYLILENKNECLNLEELQEKYTDYFYDFDYILGDYAYNKLRLKGFCQKNNPRFNQINDINTKDNYLKELCAYNCNYFLIKKDKESQKK
ncbi:MAG: YutD family protein [Erysipelotrichaceae bacterium]|nr:YutD family protein [Erysipelotrichaceae bacterium]